MKLRLWCPRRQKPGVKGHYIKPFRSIFGLTYTSKGRDFLLSGHDGQRITDFCQQSKSYGLLLKVWPVTEQEGFSSDHSFLPKPLPKGKKAERGRTTKDSTKDTNGDSKIMSQKLETKIKVEMVTCTWGTS